jgi:phosphoglucomutase
MDQAIIKKAESWLTDNYDQATQKEVQRLLTLQNEELIDAFYTDLEFGTGGLRGIMGVGSNRMNKYTVGMATQGLANYLKNKFKNKPISVAIAYDCRNNNTFFEGISADVLSANNITVYRFDALRPTPQLSFAVRHLGCQAGIVITASHNPKEYNGYKVYGEDGAQLIAPDDTQVIDEVRKIKSIKEVNFAGNKSLIKLIDNEIDELYTDEIKAISLNPQLITKHKNLKIVYTPIHGTGVKLVPMALKKFGFSHIINVAEQDVVDGNFPTVHSPNPEEPAALAMAIEKAKAENADLVMASDPDSDRVGIAVRDKNNDFVLLNGNQTAALLFYYVLNQWKEKGKLTGKEFIVKTVVTSELLIDIANSYAIDSYDVLTGFKYIAQIIREHEGKKQFILGGEESYGYLIGDFVRDKDAVASCCFIAETYAWAVEKGMGMEELLAEIYTEFGFYYETLKSVVRKGKAGADEIKAMMENFRTNPPKSINNSRVVCIKDFQLQKSINTLENKNQKIDLPKSNVIQFITEDGSKITMRPSGTEPKIKFYFGVKAPLNKKEDYDKVKLQLQGKIDAIVKDLDL